MTIKGYDESPSDPYFQGSADSNVSRAKPVDGTPAIDKTLTAQGSIADPSGIKPPTISAPPQASVMPPIAPPPGAMAPNSMPDSTALSGMSASMNMIAAPNSAGMSVAPPIAPPQPMTQGMNPALSVNGGASLATGGYQGVPANAASLRPAGSVGWDDPIPAAQPSWATDPNSEFNKPAQFQVQSNLDDWWKAHGAGAPRYTTSKDGQQIDGATIGYNAQKANVANGSLPSLGNGFNTDLDAEAAGGVAKASNAIAYGANHGGADNAQANQNAAPLTQTPTGFVNAAGAPASQGGTLDASGQPTARSGAVTPADQANPVKPGTLNPGGGTGTATRTDAKPAVGTPGPQTREQQIQSMMDSYVRPSSQSTANNTDPLSGVTTIDPTNDLRSTVITNTPSARTADYTNQVDQAAKNLPTDRAALATSLTDKAKAAIGNTNVTAGANVDPATSARLASLKALVDSSATDLAGSDRYKEAQDKFSTFAKGGQEAYDLTRRQALASASASGGSKSGMLRSQYGNLDLSRERDLDQERDRLFQDALDKSMSDRLAKNSALSSMEGQQTSQEAAQRGEQRTERDYDTSVDTGNVDRGVNASLAALNLGQSGAGAQIADKNNDINTLEGLRSASEGTDLTGAAAQRGERQFQVGQEQSAYDRALEQYNTQQRTKQQAFNNGITLLNTGENGNPSGTLTTVAGQNQAQTAADQAALSRLAESMARTGAPPVRPSGITDADWAQFLRDHPQTQTPPAAPPVTQTPNQNPPEDDGQ